MNLCKLLRSIFETLYLMASSANARALDLAIADIKAGRVTEFDP
jgi:PHD/YefM family antitoxin component YafN of YafNO toxin-antitoxin module